MKKILVLTDTYFPDSRATVSIVQRICEELVHRGNYVDVFPLGILDKKAYKYSHVNNGVNIVFNDKIRYGFKVGFLNCLLKILNCLLKLLKKILKCSFVSKTHFCKSLLKNSIKLLKFKLLFPIDNLQQIIKKCEYIGKYELKNGNYDTVISASLPFDVHIVANKYIKKTNRNWIPICFDPFAFSEELNKDIIHNGIKKEETVFKKAKRIFFLRESQKDYVNSPLYPKMCFFTIPNLVFESEKPKYCLNNKYVNVVFVGALYWKIRNPEWMLKTYEQLGFDNVKLYIIGNLSGDFPKDYIEKWKTKLGDKLEYIGRVNHKEALEYIYSADFLLNIGNMTTNQCPSKVFDYISTGKPIINISQIKGCTSKYYIDKYPLSFQIDSYKMVNYSELRIELCDFKKKCEGKVLTKEELCAIYPDCSVTTVVNYIENEFE